MSRLRLYDCRKVVKANKDEMGRLVSILESLYQIVVEPMNSARNRSHRYVPDFQKRVNELMQYVRNLRHGETSS